MMLHSKAVTVATEAFVSIICGPVRLGRITMRIVAGSAPHSVTRLLLAGAFRQRLELAQGLRSLCFAVLGKHKVVHVIGKPLSRLEIIQMLSRLPDRDCAFKVTLHADGITLLWRKFRRIHDRPPAPSMLRARPMTTLTGDSAVSEELASILAVRSSNRGSHPAAVAIQAVGIGRQVQRNPHGVDVGRRHIPSFLLGIPVDGRFEPESLVLKQIGAPLLPRSNEILQLLLSLNGIFALPFVAHPHLAALLVYAIVDSGFFVLELSLGDSVLCRSAGSGHGSLPVCPRHLLMAGGTGFIARGRCLAGTPNDGRLRTGFAGRAEQRPRERHGENFPGKHPALIL